MSKIMNNENIEKISVADFLKKYDEAESAEDKEACIKKIVIDRYVPYSEKVVYINQILNTAHFKNNVLVWNTPKEKVLYAWTLLRLYTSLNVSDNFNNEYDLIMSRNDLQAQITSYMPNDKMEFCNMFYDMKSDFNANVVNDYTQLTEAVSLGVLKGAEMVLDALEKVLPDLMNAAQMSMDIKDLEGITNAIQSGFKEA